MSLAEIIQSQIRAGQVEGCQNGLHAMCCWGAHRFTDCGDGLSFKVNGFKFKGTVDISLNGLDLYDVKFYHKDKVIVSHNDVYCNQLAQLIDSEVEG